MGLTRKWLAIFPIVIDTVLGLRSVDPDMLHLARVSNNFDRSLLRPTGDAPDAPPGKASHSSEGKGDPR